MLSIIRSHALAIATAFLIGLIYGLPHLFFIVFLDGAYRDIPMLRTPNEGSYLGRVQDIIDGHGALGSPFFFEYKNQPPLSPPTGEWFYALPALVFGISPATVLVISKFILPSVLFLLIYALMLRLTGSGGMSQKINAIACGLLIVLGYDLIDYRTVLAYFQETDSPVSFLLWAKPVNPTLGALFLIPFLTLVLALIQRTKRHISACIGASLLLALMFSSYFFSWGIAVSVLAALIVLFLFQKEYKIACTLAFVVPLGVLFSSPYWIGVWRASQSPWYEESVLRNGLFLTHYPILNKLLLAALVFYLLTLAADFFWKKKNHVAYRFEAWHSFTLALLLGGLWAYSQQMITGRTIWPYHFVQYTIPLAMVAGFALLYHIIRGWNRYLWAGVVALASLSSLWFGVYTQMKVYTSARSESAKLQDRAPLFEWLNTREKDCVVFVNEDSPDMSALNTLIPAFTHCNRYASTEFYALIPYERGLYSYLALLRLKGVSADAIDEYMLAHGRDAAPYLYSNWKGLFGVKDFPDFSDPLLEERISAFPKQYREYAALDFKTELERYRIDYILSAGPLDTKVAAQLPHIAKVFENKGLVLYEF